MSGHRRPLGTTTRVRMRWYGDILPELGDVTLERDSTRWFLLVGIEEHRDSPAVFWLTLERISEDDAKDRRRESGRFWPHCRDRRPR